MRNTKAAAAKRHAMIKTGPQNTAERIQASALSLFAQQGYEATTLAQIADQVGIRKPSLYNHIDSKESLFLALVAAVEREFFTVHDASLAASQNADIEARLFALVTDLSDFIYTEDSGAFYKRCLLFPPAALSAEIRRINELSEQRIDAALRALFAQGERERAWYNLTERRFIDAFYCLVDGLFSERFVYSRPEYTRRLRSGWTIFWAGLCA